MASDIANANANNINYDYEYTNLKFVKTFQPMNLKVLHDKGRTMIAAFEGVLGGRHQFHIREIYEEYGEWKPGKGVSVPFEHKDALLTELTKYAKG